jgi:hypothetical protein
MSVLSSIPAILQEFFILNVPTQLLICKHYSKALLPSSIIYHVTRILKLSKDVREAVAEVAAQLPPYTLDTILGKKTVLRPRVRVSWLGRQGAKLSERGSKHEYSSKCIVGCKSL